jgi:hypothetical protein
MASHAQRTSRTEHRDDHLSNSEEIHLGFRICLSTVDTVRADGLLYRLPDDGTWARYSFKQTMALPKDKKMTVEGTLTLASVGHEKVKDEVC